MIDSLLQNLDTLMLYLFAACALAGSALMLVLKQPMRVALALISTMIFLGGIYGLLGVHFIAAFQVLIYVGAVMVFMVYVIMLLDAGDPAVTRRFSAVLVPAIVLFVVFLGVLTRGVWDDMPEVAKAAGTAGFSVKEFSEAFLNEYWLHFELTSVLLVAAVVAAVAVIKVNRTGHG
jgi:NADH-quinone oxidoreductase subunit J